MVHHGRIIRPRHPHAPAGGAILPVAAPVLAIIYDIHGNLPALEAVLDRAEQEGANRYLLGGDYGTPSPWPLETLERLRALPEASWIRGNGERWLIDPPADRPEVGAVYEHYRDQVPSHEVEWLTALPTQVELDGVLYVHGSPISDDESFHPDPNPDDERLLAGVRDRTVVFGHSHLQFRRPGPNGTDLVNAVASETRWTVTAAQPGQFARRPARSSSGAPTTTGSAPPPRFSSSAMASARSWRAASNADPTSLLGLP